MFLRLSMIFLWLTGALGVFGQELPKGTFILSTGYTYTEFNFKKNSRFEYRYSCCTEAKLGSGTFMFNAGELVLNFEDPEEKLMPPSPVIKRVDTKNDTSHLLITFYDTKSKDYVPSVVVSFQSKSVDKTLGTMSSQKGEAHLRVSNIEFPAEIDITCFGADSKKLRLDSSGDYTISFPISFEFSSRLVKGDTLHFTIQEFNDRELVLKPTGADRFATFKRKGKKKV